MVRNIIGGIVLLILLGVVGFVYWDKFKDKKEAEGTTPNTNSENPHRAPRLECLADRAVRRVAPRGDRPVGSQGRRGLVDRLRIRRVSKNHPGRAIAAVKIPPDYRCRTCASDVTSFVTRSATRGGS